MKIFRVMLLVTLSLLLVSIPQSVDAEGGKIGILDLSAVFDGYDKTKEYDASLEAEHKAYENDRNAKIEKLKEAQGKLALLKEEEKEKLQLDIEKMKAELLEFDQSSRTDLTKKRDERIREILLEIESVVSDFSKKEKYDFILNDRVLIYGNEALNVTENVLKVLNENYNTKK